jgi:hypothetical protein
MEHSNGRPINARQWYVHRPPDTSNLPAGNFADYVDRESILTLDYGLPFPHVRQTCQVTRCVTRVERRDHPEVFAEEYPHNVRDIDITGLVAKGIISYDQNVIPDAVEQS